MSWEYFCPAVGSRLSLVKPRGTITSPLFSFPRFLRDQKRNVYFGGALRAENIANNRGISEYICNNVKNS